MKLTKRIFRICRSICLIFLESFLGFLLAFWCIATILSRIPVSPEVNTNKGKERVTIYLASSGVHTDLIVPIETSTINWQKELHLPDSILQDSVRHYLAFGWGEKGFYMNTKEWSDLTAGTFIVAAFHLGSSAMHVVHRAAPDPNDHYTVELVLSKKQYERLVAFIKSSFVRKNGKYVPIPDHPYSSRDFFFDAKRSYGIAYTCNSWTNRALKEAGQKACLWTAFRDGIYLQYGR